MKLSLLISLLLFSFAAFSQSYVILTNGVTLTVDKAGKVHDLDHFYLPYKVKVAAGRFFVIHTKLITIAHDGLLYEKDLEVKSVKGSGHNYFFTEKKSLVTIDAQGFYYEYPEAKLWKKDLIYGGNFFITKDAFYTVNEQGNFFKTELPVPDVAMVGGNYFQTKTGEVFVVTKEGYVLSKKEQWTGRIIKTGGNYFINENYLIFTVSEDGVIRNPYLPDRVYAHKVETLGPNYFFDTDGRFVTVDTTGNLARRSLSH